MPAGFFYFRRRRAKGCMPNTEPAGPVSLSLVGLFIAVLGPTVGPYTLILFAAVVGGLLALSVEKPGTRLEGIRFMAVGTLVALLLTSPMVWAVTAYTDVPANVALVPVAFVLGACRSQLLAVIKQVIDMAAAAVGAFLNAAANRKGGGQ